MYNGIGLQITRGTTIFGHVQANCSHVRGSWLRLQREMNVFQGLKPYQTSLSRNAREEMQIFRSTSANEIRRIDFWIYFFAVKGCNLGAAWIDMNTRTFQSNNKVGPCLGTGIPRIVSCIRIVSYIRIASCIKISNSSLPRIVSLKSPIRLFQELYFENLQFVSSKKKCECQ